MTRSRNLLLILLGVGFFLVFMHANAPSLDTDGVHYAAVAKEVARSGRFLLPFDPVENTPYFYHFPFAIWPTAAVFRLLGVCPATAKLYSMGMTLVALAGIFVLGRMLASPWAGWCAGISFLMTNHVLRIGRQCRLDLPLTAFLVWAYVGLVLAQRRSRAWYLLAGLASFGAMMTKEIVGVVPFATMIAYLFLRRQWRELFHPLLWVSIGLAIGPVIGWVLLASAHYHTNVWQNYNGQSFSYLLHGHSLTQPWYYYWLVMLTKNGYLFPLAFVGTWIAWGRIWRGKEPRWGLIMLWALALPLGFSLAEYKVHYYVLPAYAAIALLVGLACDRLIRVVWRRRLVTGVVALAVAGAVLVACFPMTLYRANFAANVRIAPKIDAVIKDAPGEVIVVRQDVSSLLFYSNEVKRVTSAHGEGFPALLARPAEARRYCLIGKKDWLMVDPQARDRWKILLDDGDRLFVREEPPA